MQAEERSSPWPLLAVSYVGALYERNGLTHLLTESILPRILEAHPSNGVYRSTADLPADVDAIALLCGLN